jgi:GT2 family glycosyltransferase
VTFDDVGFVVLTHGTGGEQAPLLESLLADRVPAASIVVVHNPTSHEDPPPQLPTPEISVLRPESNLGYAAGMNLGIGHQRERGADPIVIFTHDIRLRAGALEGLIDASRRAPAYGVVAPALMWPGSEDPFSFGGRTRPNGTNEHIMDPVPAGPDGLLDCDWVDGSAMVVRREVFEQLGGFDERFFGYCEESDLCLRAKRAGWRVGVVGDALAEQAPGAGKRPGAWAYLLTRNGIEYARRAAGARGIAATLGRSLWRIPFLGLRVVARGSGLRPGAPREPWVELVAVLRGTGDFLMGRWGPPPSNLPGLGDMTVSERPIKRR